MATLACLSMANPIICMRLRYCYPFALVGIRNGDSAVSNDGNSGTEQYRLHVQATISWWQHHF